MIKYVVVAALALLSLPAEAATLVVDPRPEPSKSRTICAAPRAPWLTAMTERHEFIAVVTMISRKIGTNTSIAQADVAVVKFLKGHFNLLKLRVYFDYECGSGGPSWNVGEKLTLYMNVNKDRAKPTAYAHYWRRTADPQD